MSGERGDGIESVACNDDGKRELDVRGDDRKKQDDTSCTGVVVTRRDQRSRMTPLSVTLHRLSSHVSSAPARWLCFASRRPTLEHSFHHSTSRCVWLAFHCIISSYPTVLNLSAAICMCDLCGIETGCDWQLRIPVPWVSRSRQHDARYSRIPTLVGVTHYQPEALASVRGMQFIRSPVATLVRNDIWACRSAFQKPSFSSLPLRGTCAKPIVSPSSSPVPASSASDR